MDNNYIVYLHTNTINNKKYVGITRQQPNKRWINGFGYRHNQHFFNAIQKYGWDNFKHQILFQQLSKDEACQKEKQLIQLYNSNDKNYGYNLTSGGQSNTQYSEQSRLKMSIAHSGERHHNYGKHLSQQTKHKIRQSQLGERSKNYGKKFTQQHRRKISQAQRGQLSNMYGRKLSQETKQKMSASRKGQKNPNSKTVECIQTGDTYCSATQAAKKFGFSRHAITNAIKNNGTCAGYHWRYI